MKRLALLLIAVVLAGCSDGTVSPGDDGGKGGFQGSVDPTRGEILLRSLTLPAGDGDPVRVDLIGTDLRIVTIEQISMRVAIRNAGVRSLHAPADVALRRFIPSTVGAVNADRTRRTSEGPEYVYDYSEAFGPYETLSPGETSDAREMIFETPDLASFSFEATASFRVEPSGPRISGFVYADPNENGRFDPGEVPFGGGQLTLSGPGMEPAVQFIPGSGLFDFPVTDPGLYSLLAMAPPTFREVHSTTPNPLEILLTNTGSNGATQSFLFADFGFANGPDPDDYPPVLLIQSPNTLPMGSYAYLSGYLEGVLLTLNVGYSGCQPEHPFALAMIDGFMESNPVQARLVLSHDWLGEPCTAWFERVVSFDLRPIRAEHERVYGQPGVVLLNLVDDKGEVHRFELNP